MAIAVQPITLHRVIVTNTINHELIGDLQGSLSHDRRIRRAQQPHLRVRSRTEWPAKPAPLTSTTTATSAMSARASRSVMPTCSTPTGRAACATSPATRAWGSGCSRWWIMPPNHVGTNISLQHLPRAPARPGQTASSRSSSRNACREDFVEVPDERGQHDHRRGRRFRHPSHPALPRGVPRPTAATARALSSPTPSAAR